MFAFRKFALRLIFILAAATLGVASGSMEALAQGLEKPTDTVCKECATAGEDYAAVWQALQAKIKEVEPKRVKLKAEMEEASDELSAARRRNDTKKKEALEKKIDGIQASLDALGESVAVVRRSAEPRKTTLESCIKHQCFGSVLVPSPPSAEGKAELCGTCAPIADRVADLSRRIAELRKLQAELVKQPNSEHPDHSRALINMFHSLETMRNLRQLELEDCRAENKEKCAIDKCLVGKWESDSITFITEKTPRNGGRGIVLVVEADGRATIDYDKMTTIKFASGVTYDWRGTASGRIDARNGTVTLKSVEKSNIVQTVLDPRPGVKPEHRRLDQPFRRFGHATPGGRATPGRATADSSSYSCDESRLKYQGEFYDFTFERAK